MSALTLVIVVRLLEPLIDLIFLLLFKKRLTIAVSVCHTKVEVRLATGNVPRITRTHFSINANRSRHSGARAPECFFTSSPTLSGFI